MTILDKLAAHAVERVEEAKKRVPLEEIKAQALKLEPGKFAFEKKIASKKELSFICECKKASPSKGLICPDYRYLEIAKAYEEAGADCISVLTEPGWFLGSSDHLKEIAAAVSLPIIRKDFVVDEYMIYEAHVLGASAVLLICAILEPERLAAYIKICDSLGLSALVEIHDTTEAQIAVNAGARMIGVNNRNLKDFSVDTHNSARLRKLIPSDILFVSESGVKCGEDTKALHEIGSDAVLVGETMMRAENKAQMLKELKGVK